MLNLDNYHEILDIDGIKRFTCLVGILNIKVYISFKWCSTKWPFILLVL